MFSSNPIGRSRLPSANYKLILILLIAGLPQDSQMDLVAIPIPAPLSRMATEVTLLISTGTVVLLSSFLPSSTWFIGTVVFTLFLESRVFASKSSSSENFLSHRPWSIRHLATYSHNSGLIFKRSISGSVQVIGVDISACRCTPH